MNRIKELLARKGLTVKWIAKQIGCHATEVSQWIAGRRNPNLIRAIKLADLLDCSVEDLFPTTTKQQGENNENSSKEQVQEA